MKCILVLSVILLLYSYLPDAVLAFVPHRGSAVRPVPQAPRSTTPTPTVTPPSHSARTTRLRALLDVPDGFFTITFFMSGILLSISKNFARIRREENAWEQRLAEGRAAALRSDPTLTELDLRRQEAAAEWSAYGKPRWEEEERLRKRQRVKVMERDDYDDDEPSSSRRRKPPSHRRMTDAEIEAFELEYGVPYDPYYDEPYTADELPQDMSYQTDKRYGDRIYENGEIFYKHGEDAYFRQGAKPRNLKFWD